MSAWTGRPLRVALCSGLLLRHDAISNSLRLKLDLLRRLRAEGAPVQVTAFVRASDERADDVVCVPHVSAMVRHPGFAEANVFVFEFGIYYDLFDAVFLLDPNRVIGVYHNITPVELVEDAVVREAIGRSLQQKHNFVQVGHIACDSELNRDDLLEFDLPPERLTVLHLPPARPTMSRRVAAPGDAVELLFLGRIVKAKGVADLIEACDRLAADGVDGFRLSVVGPSTFSDAAILANLEEHAARTHRFQMLGELDDDAVARVMSRTDVFVMPSYHEGYCVPVIEAYQAGCQVVAYDSANLPNVVAGLGQLVACGDVDALTRALRQVIERIATARQDGGPVLVPTTSGMIAEAQWRAGVDEHLKAHSQEAYDDGFLALVARAAAGAPAEPVGSSA